MQSELLTKSNNFYCIYRSRQNGLNDEVVEGATRFVISLFPLMHLLSGRKDAEILTKSVNEVSNMYMQELPKRDALEEMRRVCLEKTKIGVRGKKDINSCNDVITRLSQNVYGNSVSHANTNQRKPRKSDAVQPRQLNDRLPSHDSGGSNIGEHAAAKPVVKSPANKRDKYIPLKHTHEML